MKRIIDTFKIQTKPGLYMTLPIDREIPTMGDVHKKLGYADAIKAIELMACTEEHIRRHLRIGSTPPTRIKLNDTAENMRLQSLIFETFNEVFILEE